MSSVAGGTGLTPIQHPSGMLRARAYTIASGYATNLFKGDPVKLVTAGTIQLGTSDGTRTGTVDNISLLGVFAGCEYVDSTGKPTVSSFWPTGTTATNIVAYVYDDPLTQYSIKADGSIAATAVGDQADLTGFSAPGGSTSTGLSSCTLSSSLVGAGQQGQFRIIDVDRSADNAWGDSYTKVIVQIAEHQFVAEITAV